MTAVNWLLGLNYLQWLFSAAWKLRIFEFDAINIRVIGGRFLNILEKSITVSKGIIFFSLPRKEVDNLKLLKTVLFLSVGKPTSSNLNTLTQLFLLFKIFQFLNIWMYFELMKYIYFHVFICLMLYCNNITMLLQCYNVCYFKILMLPSYLLVQMVT